MTILNDRSSEHRLRYRVNYFELLTPPNQAPVPIPSERGIQMARAKVIPLWYFFALYDAVGYEYQWQDMHLKDREEVQKFLDDDRVEMHTMLRHGYPQGFFLLDWRQLGICDIAYFGLVREAIGKGLGGWLLDFALDTGWRRGGVAKMTVNTCTFDHPNARGLYEGRGFSHIGSEIREREPMELCSHMQRKDKEC